MKKMKLTISFIKKLIPGEVARYADTEVPGLQCRVMQKSVSYYVRKRQGPVIHEILLGKHPDMTLDEARNMALDKLGAIANYQNINAGSGRRSPLLREAFEFYLAAQKNQACVKSAISHFKPLLERKISDIDPSEVKRIFESMSKTPYAANNAIKYLSAAINRLSRNLGISLPGLTNGIVLHDSIPRTRIMRESEAPAILDQLKKLAKRPLYSEQAEALLIMIYTGQRKSRVLGMRGDQIDCEFRRWDVPGNDIKRPVQHSFNDFSWEIISRRIKERGSGYLFLWRGKPIMDCRKTFATVCRMCGIEELHVHDLRRSLGSWMISSGASIETVSKTLGHSSIRVTERVYAHLLASKGRKATSTAIEAMNKGNTD